MELLCHAGSSLKQETNICFGFCQKKDFFKNVLILEVKMKLLDM